MKRKIWIPILGLTIALAACGNSGGKAKESTVSEATEKAEVKESESAESSEKSEKNEETVKETENSAGAGESDAPISKAKLKLKYSNLVDAETRERVEAALKNAGLKEDKIKSFFAAVDEYNNAVGKENLVQEMTTIDAGFPSLDSDKLVDAWLDKGGYVGRNCRITAFSLMGDFITVGNPTPGETTMLFSDFDAISAKQIFTGEAKKNYDTVFSYIDVENTQDTAILSSDIVQSWKEKEISFHNDKMHMISVFMTMDDGLNKVQEFIGHVGVLVQDGDKYLFIEKLAFELPYQVDEFSSLQDVNDYLMGYYDKDADGLTAKPVIFKDGEMMKEYRVLD